jgi:hypothetical protein
MNKPKHPFANLPIPIGELGNVGLICQPCSIFQRVSGAVLDNQPAWFVGKYCKIKFFAKDKTVERMWVNCKGVREDGVTLWGVLSNDPVLPMQIKCGDPVNFMKGEILDIQDA